MQLRNKTPKRRVKAKLREDRKDAIGPNDVWCHCTLINQNLALNYPIRSVAACILNFHIVPLIIRLYP